LDSRVSNREHGHIKGLLIQRFPLVKEMLKKYQGAK
jgi:hypothetical protein